MASITPRVWSRWMRMVSAFWDRPARRSLRCSV